MTQEIYLLNPATGHVERIHPRRKIQLKFTPKTHKRLAMLEDPRVYDERVGAISYPKK
jgi:hypothetical protein